jgi:bifunctional non-homologous end joining protein LigD
MLWCISRRTPPAGFIQPCQPTIVAAPPAGPGWLHEVKHDGYRILARKQGERVEVWSRRGADFTDRFPKIAEAVRKLPAESALIDGEAVAFRPDGLPPCAPRRAASRPHLSPHLLSLGGDDLKPAPLKERRDALARLVAGVDAIRFSEAAHGRGRDCVRPRQSQPLSERAEPQLAEVLKPGVSANGMKSQQIGRKKQARPVGSGA